MKIFLQICGCILLIQDSAWAAPLLKTESEALSQYTGVLGSGITNSTITTAGAAFELTPSGTNYYGFFAQTLSNGLYYEGRLYTRYNYLSQNPVFPSIPASDENNPLGYGAVFKIGYDFRPTNLIDIVPYLRFNAYRNMSAVYQDNQGNSISSDTYAYLLGSKIAYKVTPEFNPYIDIYGGYQQVLMDGKLNSATSNNISAKNNQLALTYEIGFSSKLTKNIALIPYFQYVTTSNSPDSTAQASYVNNGFNISPLTSTQVVYGLKLSVSW